MLGSIAFLALLAASVVEGKRADYALKERHFVPKKWDRVGSAPAEHVLNIQIGLKQGNFEQLEKLLFEVSDPDHASYGQHLSEEEINDLVKPADDALEMVHQWLNENGIGESQLEYSPAKDWIKLSLPVKDVESLLDTKYSVYVNEDDADYIVRTPEWSLPKYLHHHIDVVQPTNSFFRPKAQRSDVLKVVDQSQFSVSAQKAWSGSVAPTIDQVCNASSVTTDCLRTLYGTYSYVPQVPGKNRVGLNNYLGEANNRSDVKIFLENYRPDAVSAAYSFKTVVIDNGSDQQTPLNASALEAGTDLEGNLDAETIIGISYPTPLTTFNTGGEPPFIIDANTPTDTNEPYLTWLQYALAKNTSELPQVISTSYGDDEQTIPYSYARSVCNGFAQLGARGITVIFSSGDDGVGADGTCLTNDGKNTTTFLPAFPAGCPYVTTVGATKNIAPEIVAYDARNGFVSGGGFSNYFPRPSYQNNVVPPYVKALNGSFAGLYNKTGRAYPDISAQGYHFVTIWNGTEVSLDGTSASAPTATAVLSLVNDALIAAGRPTLGFLNPWLYKLGHGGFTDVTSGSALGCGTAGFPATKGWDAVTGWGTPYLPRIQALALNKTAAY